MRVRVCVYVCVCVCVCVSVSVCVPTFQNESLLWSEENLENREGGTPPSVALS